MVYLLGFVSQALFFTRTLLQWVLSERAKKVLSPTFLNNTKIPLWLIIWGSAGQVIFTMRFVYQWIYLMRRNESLLPVGFWIISLIGSGIIASYGVIRVDPILILGQSVGFIAYTHNIAIYRKEQKMLLHD